MLFDTLRDMNSSIEMIHCYSNIQIGDKCMKSVGEYIKSNKSIESIYFSYSTITDAGIEIFLPYIQGNTALKLLFLDSNKGITNRSTPLLLKIIESSRIENLNVDGTAITQKNIFIVPLACNAIKNGSNALDLTQK